MGLIKPKNANFELILFSYGKFNLIKIEKNLIARRDIALKLHRTKKLLQYLCYGKVSSQMLSKDLCEK